MIIIVQAMVQFQMEVSSSEAMNETGVVVNVSSNLRVRKEASSNSLVLGYLLNNQTVTITGKEGNWYKINFNGFQLLKVLIMLR